MCLIVFAYQRSEKYPLILLANRDEFYDRPTRGVHFWEDAPEVFAGRDLARGGTWLGITKTGRFAALTNFRQAGGVKGTISRGNLVSRFLQEDMPVSDYLENVKERSSDYSGFNLLVGDFSEKETAFAYYSNRGDQQIRMLDAGIYGLSNHLLDTPWPKVLRAKSGLAEILENPDDPGKERCFELLQNRTLAEDPDLPDTGIGPEREKILSPIFIETPVYGTRCSSIVLLDKEHGLSLDEHVFY